MRKRTLFIVAVAAFAVGALLVGPAQAAVQNMLVGTTNESNKQTTIKNTAGIPLSLSSPEGVPSLKVNHSDLITLLNADKLDGLHATSFARSTMKTGVIVSGSPHLDTETGFYVATATCPEGTLRTGGGSHIASSTVYASAPEGDRGWTVIGLFDARAYAICLSPSGSDIPGASTMSTQDVLTTFKRFANKQAARASNE
jgi:hypothetical protein